MYLSTTALQINTVFNTDYYNLLGREFFDYHFIDFFDDEVNYALTGENITALPLLDPTTSQLNYVTTNYGKNTSYMIDVNTEGIFLKNSTPVQVYVKTQNLQEGYYISIIKPNVFNIKLSTKINGIFSDLIELDENTDNFYITINKIPTVYSGVKREQEILLIGQKSNTIKKIKVMV